ncbi:hypothetical protein [uncultured Sphingomonas sp.]|uniref:hypothetical protein n=1 Tax=uncultured Sphingomonas sp. TaxID=158754 RepID=UPI0035CBA3B3
MRRIDDDALTLHFEVALAAAEPSLMGELQQGDRFRRSAAVSALAYHLADRMRCFDIAFDEGQGGRAEQPSLFPDDLQPIG